MIVAGGLGILPELHSQSHGMEEPDYLHDPAQAAKLENAWNTIDDLKQRNALSRDELISTDNARAVLIEVNTLLEENWREGEETFMEFIARVPRFFPEETFAETDPSTASPEQAKNAINNIKAMMRSYKFNMEFMIIMQYQNYGQQKREHHEAVERNREATKSIPIPLGKVDRASMKSDDRGLYTGTSLSEFPQLMDGEKIKNIMKAGGLTFDEAQEIINKRRESDPK